jgi:hypothetical protein
MLMYSSTLVSYWTGKSAGFSLFRMSPARFLGWRVSGELRRSLARCTDLLRGCRNEKGRSGLSMERPILLRSPGMRERWIA